MWNYLKNVSCNNRYKKSFFIKKLFFSKQYESQNDPFQYMEQSFPHCLAKYLACLYKSTCVKLIANKSECFQNSAVIETRSLDFHKLTFTAMKVFCIKHKANIIQQREYRNFYNEAFINDPQYTCFQERNFEALSFDRVVTPPKISQNLLRK